MFAQVRASLDTFNSPIPVHVFPVCTNSKAVDMKLSEELINFIPESVALHPPYKVRSESGSLESFGPDFQKLKEATRKFCTSQRNVDDELALFERLAFTDYRRYELALEGSIPVTSQYSFFVAHSPGREHPHLELAATNMAVLFVGDAEVRDGDALRTALRTVSHALQNTWFADWSMPLSPGRVETYKVSLEDSIGRGEIVYEHQLPPQIDLSMRLASPPGVNPARWGRETGDFDNLMANSLRHASMLFELAVSTSSAFDAALLLPEKDDRSDLVHVHERHLSLHDGKFALSPADMTALPAALHPWLKQGDVLARPQQAPPLRFHLIAVAAEGGMQTSSPSSSSNEEALADHFVIPGQAGLVFIGPVEAPGSPLTEGQTIKTASAFNGFLRSLVALPMTTDKWMTSFTAPRLPPPRKEHSYLERLVVSGNDFAVPPEYHEKLRVSRLHADVSDLSYPRRALRLVKNSPSVVVATDVEEEDNTILAFSPPEEEGAPLTVRISPPSLLGTAEWEHQNVCRGVVIRWALESTAILRKLQRRLQVELGRIQIQPRVAFLMRSALDKLNMALGAVSRAPERTRFSGDAFQDRLYIEELRKSHEKLIKTEAPPDLRLALTGVRGALIDANEAFKDATLVNVRWLGWEFLGAAFAPMMVPLLLPLVVALGKRFFSGDGKNKQTPLWKKFMWGMVMGATIFVTSATLFF